MKLNCKPGDLAVVAWDEPGCLMNVGRLVKIHGPLRVNADLGATWLIVPARRTKWYVIGSDGVVRYTTARLRDRVEHADKWLIPIRPDSSGEAQPQSDRQPLKGMEHPEVMASMQQRVDAGLAKYLLDDPLPQRAEAPRRSA
jgi:hypothetical protein